jgi:Tfp pilus assembly protein PilE
MSRLSRDEGYTLVEVLLVCIISTILLGATLTTFAATERNSREASDTNALQDETRFVVDQVARQLRNIASQSENVFRPIERAEGNDLIFRVVRRTGTVTATNPTNIQRVRYCMNGRNQLYQQTQVLTDTATAAPAGTACPLGAGWTRQRVLTGVVTNGDRPAFHYMQAEGSPQTYTESTSVVGDPQLERIVGVRLELFVDDDLRRAPAETSLSTRVFLRNQNRKPTAVFSAVPGAGMSLQLNGGDSTDPEGARLTFKWFDKVGTAAERQIGEGAVFTYSSPNLTAGTHSLRLEVRDAGGNTVSSPVQTFSCQTSTGCIAL